jgi:oxygen-independent coproporphyrinogen-3 oxidase
MAGIYLHVPFCRQACYYCNFHFSTSLKRKNDFVVALLKEMDLQKNYIGGDPVETIYFGGGTPSLLEAGELDQILERLRADFSVEGGAEITLEANPDDITPFRLGAWKKAGINRLSVGVQSFFEEDLRWMNRAHSAGQAVESIRMAQGEGFDHISIDLIYGTPTLPDARWEKNVEQAFRLHIPHLSCYALTVEPRTALDKMIHLKKKEDINPDDQARQFLLLMEWMAEAGYEHYEISNFSLPGQRSRHNSSYWQGKSYLGLGPSAHSYNGVSRQWNIADNALYIDTLLAATPATGGTPWQRESNLSGKGFPPGNPLFDKEDLTRVQQLNEYIMISLRTMEGLDLNLVSERFGKEDGEDLITRSMRYVEDGKMLRKNEHLILTREGKLLADGIASQLFFGN